MNKKHLKETYTNRPLKPKISTIMPFASIEAISVFYNEHGHAFLMTYPSQIVIDSMDLILMIEAKKDFLAIENAMYVRRRDILSAVYNFSVTHSSPNSLQYKPEQTDNIAKIDPKRPTNAFIIFNNTFRKKVKNYFPNYTNSEISKFIGAMWKAVTNDVRENYINQALECRKLHKINYPHFVYNIRRKTNSIELPNSQETSSNEWEKYFNWCFQNMTTEAASGMLYNDINGQPQIVNDCSTNTCLEINPENFNLPESEQFDNWKDVCDIVSQFFPEEPKSNNYIDEYLWDILNNFTTSNDINNI